MKSQREICVEIILSLRSQGFNDQEIILKGSVILFESYKRGEWMKVKGNNDDHSILKYSREVLKDSLKKDKRVNGGIKYSPINPRGPRIQKSPEDEIRELESRIEEIRIRRKVG
jgi:hypothetical protein